MDQPGFDAHTHIPGTTIFDGAQAMKGYNLNKMCFSFNRANNRDAFKEDAEGYMNKYELTEISRMELVEKAGAQGTEFLMWMMMRGALGDNVTQLNRNYHIPVSNTGAGTLLLECG